MEIMEKEINFIVITFQNLKMTILALNLPVENLSAQPYGEELSQSQSKACPDPFRPTITPSSLDQVPMILTQDSQSPLYALQLPTRPSCNHHGEEGHQFSMEMNLNSVREVWEEYFHGVNGRISVRERNKLGVNWKKQAGVKSTFYNNRRVIWCAVQEVAEVLSVSQEDAAGLLDKKCRDNDWNIRNFRAWLIGKTKETKSRMGYKEWLASS